MIPIKALVELLLNTGRRNTGGAELLRFRVITK